LPYLRRKVRTLQFCASEKLARAISGKVEEHFL